MTKKLDINGMKNNLLRILALLSILILWQILARIVDVPLILPKPELVFIKMIELLGQSSFWISFLCTSIRCICSFLITVIAGAVLGILCGIWQDFYIFLEVPVAIIRSTPVVSFILIAIFWFPSGVIPVFISVVMTFPIMLTSVYTGFLQIDSKLLKMAKVFNLSKIQVLMKIQLPGIKKQFMAGMISVFGLTWKVVAAGEVLSLPRKAVGTILQRSQIQLESAEVIAITLFYVAVSFVLGKLPAVFEHLNFHRLHRHQNQTH